ncbi:hypothetical protein AZZ88_004619 [Escherichia coli]|nr:hypothetical protein AZZ88_004619 [Escherichia coli]
MTRKGLDIAVSYTHLDVYKSFALNNSHFMFKN